MALKLTNNAVSRLSSGITAAETTITLTPGDGAKFPVLSAGDWFPATIIRASDSAIEVIKVTARATDVLTVSRAQEGTAAISFVSGDRIEVRLTAASVLSIPETAIGSATTKTVPVDADTLAIVDSASSSALKQISWANIKSAIWSALGALINGGSTKTTPVDADAIALMDSAASNATKSLSWANIKATLKTYFDTLYQATGSYLSTSGGSMTGLLKFSAGTNIASSATVNLSAATGNTVHITGTTGISAWTMTTGQFMQVIFDGVLTLTHHATNNNLQGAANITTAAGDRATVYFDGTTTYVFGYHRSSGRALVTPLITSVVRLNTGNGAGSTNTKYRRFANVVTNVGSDITYTDSATLGASFTINSEGVYTISYSESINTPTIFGILLNDNQPNTAINSTTQSNILAAGTVANSGFISNASWTGYLQAGVVITAKTDNSGNNGPAAQFSIYKVL